MVTPPHPPGPFPPAAPPDIVFIRPARPEDSQALYDVFCDAVATLCPQDYAVEQVQALLANKSLHYRHARSWGDVVVVATLNGVVIGFAAAIWDTICAAYVQPRQARRGVGRALVQALEDHARSRRLTKLYVTASLTGEPLYRACGYQVVSSTIVLVSGVELNCTKLEKWLIPQTERTDPVTSLFRSMQWLLKGP
jgi:GNAT superfamily N-acetyltransferase